MNNSFHPFEFCDIPENATVREHLPTTISDKHKADFDATLRMAGQADRSGDTDLLFVWLGLDMGTSSTKVVVRLPFEPSQPCIPVPAPQHCRSSNHPALWQTVLWERDGTLLAYPDHSACSLHNLKQAAMAAPYSSQTLLHSTRPIQVVAAYLGYVIRHAKGWLLKNRPLMFRRRTLRWVVHVGLPANSCDETQLAKAYRRMVLAGTQLAKLPDKIRLVDAETMLRRNDIVNGSESNEHSLSLPQGVAVFPEIAAATTSFSKSNERANGLYLIVDVGAMTMDVCAFYLGQKKDKDTYSVFAADVRPLGVEAHHWFLQNGRSNDEFRFQISHSLKNVVTKAKHEYRNADEFRRGNDLPTFFVGGGSNSPIHKGQLEKLSKWMSRYYKHDGLRQLEIKVPTAVDMTSINDSLNPFDVGSSSGQRTSDIASPHDLKRLFVALGLSYPHDEIGKVFLPSEIPPVHPDPNNDHRRNFVSKDDV